MWDEESSCWIHEGSSIPALPGDYWYAAPALVEPASPNFRPLDLAITLHNARLHQGRALPHLWAHYQFYSSQGTPCAPLTTYKAGDAGRAENLLERARLKVNPNAPVQAVFRCPGASHFQMSQVVFLRVSPVNAAAPRNNQIEQGTCR